jgi:hypothetical protein
MLGFVVGAVSLFALIRLLRRGRGGGCGRGGWRHHHHHHRHGHGCGGGCGGGYGRRHHGWSGGFAGDTGFGDDDEGGFDDGNRVVFLRSLFTRLETTPGQEKVIVESLKELKGSFAKARAAARKSSRDLGDALQGEQLSMDAMGSVFASLDEGTAAVRDGAFSALTRIHEVLDPRQRRILADLVARGGGLEDLGNAV